MEIFNTFIAMLTSRFCTVLLLTAPLFSCATKEMKQEHYRIASEDLMCVKEFCYENSAMHGAWGVNTAQANFGAECFRTYSKFYASLKTNLKSFGLHKTESIKHHQETRSTVCRQSSISGLRWFCSDLSNSMKSYVEAYRNGENRLTEEYFQLNEMFSKNCR